MSDGLGLRVRVIYQCALHDGPLTVSHLNISGAEKEGSKSDAAESKCGGVVFIYIYRHLNVCKLTTVPNVATF